jgi:hypothetical protein
MSMKKAVNLVSVASLFLMTGCKNHPISKGELIGRYEYYLEDKAQGTTCFTLNGDDSFITGDTKFAATDGPTLPPEGTWQLTNETHQQVIDLAHSGFPLERSRSSIKALVNDDLGMSCNLSK